MSASRALPGAAFTLADMMGQLHRTSTLSIIPSWLALVFARNLSWSLAACCVAFAYASITLLCLALADADLGLLARGHAEQDAYLNKTVLIVGASRGLGAELARHLAKAGAVLILSSRSETDLQAVKESCTGPNSDRITTLPLDVLADESTLQRFARSADALHGGIHYAFLAAGSSQSAVAEETEHAIGAQVLRLNAEGCIAVGRALLPLMLERRQGHIVPISSMAGLVASPGQAEYAAAKHAVRGYFASVAAEVADRGVGATVACPGPIAGEATRMVFGAHKRVEKAEDGSKSKKVPMSRCCQLICDAAAHGVPEAWIARHPVLAVAYLLRFAPGLGAALLARVGPKRARALSEGRSGYDYGLMNAESAGK